MTTTATPSPDTEARAETSGSRMTSRTPVPALPVARRKAIAALSIAGLAIAGAIVIADAAGDGTRPAAETSSGGEAWYGTADAAERWNRQPHMDFGSADAAERWLERPLAWHDSADAAERALRD